MTSALETPTPAQNVKAKRSLIRGLVKDDKSLWHHARIVLERPAGSTVSSFTTSITVDGTTIDNVGGVDPGATGGSKVRIGAFGTSPTLAGSMHAQYDNVVIRRW